MAHRRIYIHEDKSNNAIDFFGDVYNENKNDSEVAKVLRDEFERQRLEKDEELRKARIEKELGQYASSPVFNLISRKVDLKDEISTYKGHFISRLTPSLLIDISLCLFISLVIGAMFTAVDAIITLLGSLVGTVPVLILIDWIDYMWKLSKLEKELDDIERRISKR